MGSNKRSIPEIQARLRVIAEDLQEPELAELADEMSRNSPVTRAKSKSSPCTAEMAEEMRQHAAANPTLHQRHIAEQFNVNPGRVSEALTGKR